MDRAGVLGHDVLGGERDDLLHLVGGQRTGEQVFGEVCKNCHEAGLAGAPKFGDKTAWAHVLAEGEQLAVDHAIHGIRAMPAKGGNPDLTDDEVHRAVAYMANAGGANWKAPAVNAAPPTQSASGAPSGGAGPISTAAAAPAAPPSSAAAAPTASAKPDGWMTIRWRSFELESVSPT